MAYDGDFRINLFPFCDNEFIGKPTDAWNCVGCDYVWRALGFKSNGTAVRNIPCNPDIHEYPLPLYKCELCDRSSLDGALAYIIVVSCLTIALNAWSILVWSNAKRKRPQIFFKLSLAVSDFLFGAVVLPEAAAHLVRTMYAPNEEFYAFYKILEPETWVRYYKDQEALFHPSHVRFSAATLYITQGASLCSILLLNVDRHIAIAHGLRYSRIMTKMRSLLLIFGMWIFIVVLGTILTHFTESFFVKPSSLFLPLADGADEVAKIVVIYTAPLAAVFAVNVLITCYTSHELSKRSANRSKGATFLNCCRAWKPTSAKRPSQASTTVNEKSAKPHDKDIEGGKADSTVIPNAHADGSVQQSVAPANKESPEEGENNRKKSKVIQAKMTQKLSAAEDSNCGQKKTDSLKNDRVSVENRTLNESIESVLSVSEDETSGAIQDTTLPIQNANLKRRSTQGSEHRAANCTLMLILLIYALCVLPLTVLLVTQMAEDRLRYVTYENVDTPYNSVSIGFVLTVGLFMTSSLWNCVIYSVRNREYRKTTKTLIRGFLKQMKIAD